MSIFARSGEDESNQAPEEDEECDRHHDRKGDTHQSADGAQKRLEIAEILSESDCRKSC